MKTCSISADGVLTVANARVFRAVTYMPSGQRVECWLPAGRYQVGGVAKLRSSRDSDEMSDARELKPLGNQGGFRWYIAESVFLADPAVQAAMAIPAPTVSGNLLA